MADDKEDKKKKETEAKKIEEMIFGKIIDATHLRHKKITEATLNDGDIFYFYKDVFLSLAQGSYGQVLFQDTDKPAWLNGDSVAITYDPTHYTETSATIAGHLEGLDSSVDSAYTLASNAHSDAATAQATANDAHSDAAAAYSAATAAQSTANDAHSDAAAAQSTANDAHSDAAAAQATADAAYA